ncbi:cyclic peptide export ABC transporter [Catenovulum sediminis]|uniref:cyclic peptide export ABC transporter n=1 Tax=Catenovulum sediminis TaxID=1740262 RepID=UPI0011801998|nr:cyclic peptide export ABC transporter [Catenovulum sediminis]
MNMELKNISDLFWRVSPNLFFASILLGIITGLSYATLIPFILYATASDKSVNNQLSVENYNFFNSPTSEMGWVFVLICIGIVAIKSTSTILSMYIAERASVVHRISLYKRINALPYANLERIGQAKLINLLNVDIPALTVAAANLPVIWISLVTVLGTLGYLIYLNSQVFFFVIACLFISVVCYQLPIFIGLRFFSKSREYYDQVQLGVKGLIYGAKELKLNHQRAEQYIEEELFEPEKSGLSADVKGKSIIIFAQVYGEMISFLVIGAVIFHLPYLYSITTTELFGIVLALLYLTGPVGIILNAMGELQQGKVALKKIKTFYQELTEEDLAEQKQSIQQWDRLKLHQVSYYYPNRTNQFALNNVCFELKKSQITFIVGGNGSGKSTLSKLISMHYLPSSGAVYIGDQQIDKHNIRQARSLISAIYTDFFVFEKIYGEHQQNKIQSYLEKLELADKVSVVNHRLDTTALSDGQRKRLALLALLLDDKPICLFDEWAADQDPRFKKIFYQDILPMLKSSGKMVIVISHDDRYFDCADQIIIMEQGSVRDIKQLTQKPALAC